MAFFYITIWLLFGVSGFCMVGGITIMLINHFRHEKTKYPYQLAFTTNGCIAVIIIVAMCTQATSLESAIGTSIFSIAIVVAAIVSAVLLGKIFHPKDKREETDGRTA